MDFDSVFTEKGSRIKKLNKTGNNSTPFTTAQKEREIHKKSPKYFDDFQQNGPFFLKRNQKTFQQLDAVMKTMNLEKITATMDKFEKSFENLELTTSVMEGSMGDAMATSAPSGQVDALIQQVINLYCHPMHIL